VKSNAPSGSTTRWPWPSWTSIISVRRPVLRRGSWISDPRNLRSVSRFILDTGGWYNISGFRVGWALTI
jgi:hypothetical protein